MTAMLDAAYWNSILSGASYGDKDDGVDLTNSAAAVLNSTALSSAFMNKYTVLDISTTSSPTDTGFAAMVAKDINTGKVTIAFRGTEPSLSDYSTDALAIASGVAAGQIVDMYNYLLRVFAADGAVVDQYVYDVGAGALRVDDTATGLGLVTTGTTVDFTGHSLGGLLALAASRLFENKPT